MDLTLESKTMSINVPGGDPVEIDPYEAYDLLRRVWETDDRWNHIRKWIAEKLDVDPDSLVMSQLLAFNDHIISLCETWNEERKKKVLEIVSLPPSTQESQEISSNGATK